MHRCLGGNRERHLPSPKHDTRSPDLPRFLQEDKERKCFIFFSRFCQRKHESSTHTGRCCRFCCSSKFLIITILFLYSSLFYSSFSLTSLTHELQLNSRLAGTPVFIWPPHFTQHAPRRDFILRLGACRPGKTINDRRKNVYLSCILERDCAL